MLRPASIVVTYTDQAELVGLLDELEPGLTATIQGEEDEAELVRGLLPSLTRLAGRLLWNDWPTGVTVSWAQQHGGPYPGTTAPTSTSVGTAAIERFLRPVAWQGFPDALLPRHCRRPTPGSCPAAPTESVKHYQFRSQSRRRRHLHPASHSSLDLGRFCHAGKPENGTTRRRDRRGHGRIGDDVGHRVRLHRFGVTETSTEATGTAATASIVAAYKELQSVSTGRRPSVRRRWSTSTASRRPTTRA